MTQTAQHTRGPWHIWNAGNEDEPMMMVHSSSNKEVAICATGDVSQAEENANARLIAAAPDLLEACQYIVEAGEGGDEVTAVERASAAIARAKGITA